MVHTPRDPLGRLLRILALRPATEGHTPGSMTPITADQASTTADMDVTKSAEEDPLSPNVWVVRASGDKYAEHFVTGGYAAVEWEPIELSSVGSLNQLRRRYREAYPDDNARQVGVNVKQLAAFHLDMREGDYVIPAAGHDDVNESRGVLHGQPDLHQRVFRPSLGNPDLRVPDRVALPGQGRFPAHVAASISRWRLSAGTGMSSAPA